MHWYKFIYLINIPEPVQYHIYAMAFPFDLRCESVTLGYNHQLHGKFNILFQVIASGVYRL